MNTPMKRPLIAILGGLALAAALPGALCAQPAAPASASGGSGAGGGEAQGPVLAVIPPALAAGGRLGDGCWVHLFDGQHYRGEQLVLVGPLALPTMARATPWWRRWNSAAVGPEARLSIHAGEDFQQDSVRLQPGQRVPDLAAPEVGWFGRIGSVRVDCGAR